MATTSQSTADQKEFEDSFNTESQAKPEVSEDEAFGISPEEKESEAPAEETPAETAPTEATETAPEPEPEPVAEVDPVQDGDAGSAETPSEEAAEENPSTGMSVEEAKQLIASDFGDEYVEAIMTLMKGVAKECAGHDMSETIGSLDKRINGLIDDIRNERESNHFGRIKEAHEDFQELVGTPEFTNWVESNPDKENITRIVQSGSAKEIISMLNDFKASQKPAEPDSSQFQWDDEASAAEGVRSGGALKLPEPAKGGQSYEDAWNEK